MTTTDTDSVTALYIALKAEEQAKTLSINVSLLVNHLIHQMTVGEVEAAYQLWESDYV